MWVSASESANSETVSTVLLSVAAGRPVGVLHAGASAASPVAMRVSAMLERRADMRCREDTEPRPSGSTHDHCLTSLVPIPSLARSEEHTSELQSLTNLVCRLLLEKKKK